MSQLTRGSVSRIIQDDQRCLAQIETDCLYPGGGGQPPDRAVIHQQNRRFSLSQTREIDGFFYWILDSPGLQLGEVMIERDELYHWEVSQQHTVQHIFSGIALHDYGWKSDGFTIFPQYSKIELLGADLDENKYNQLENQTNQMIIQGIPVRIFEAKEEDLLRKADNPDHTRVVKIEGIDQCCCGGTHVATTDQIGGFAILEIERKNKESVRISFAAGLRLSQLAKHHLQREHGLRDKLKGDIEERIDILLRENDRYRDNEKEYLQMIADLIPTKDPIVKFLNLPLGLDSLKYLSLAISQKGLTSSLINREGYFVLSGPQSQLLFEELKQRGAKGGGVGVITGKIL